MFKIYQDITIWIKNMIVIFNGGKIQHKIKNKVIFKTSIKIPLSVLILAFRFANYIQIQNNLFPSKVKFTFQKYGHVDVILV